MIVIRLKTGGRMHNAQEDVMLGGMRLGEIRLGKMRVNRLIVIQWLNQ